VPLRRGRRIADLIGQVSAERSLEICAQPSHSVLAAISRHLSNMGFVARPSPAFGLRRAKPSAANTSQTTLPVRRFTSSVVFVLLVFDPQRRRSPAFAVTGPWLSPLPRSRDDFLGDTGPPSARALPPTMCRFAADRDGGRSCALFLGGRSWALPSHAPASHQRYAVGAYD